MSIHLRLRIAYTSWVLFILFFYRSIHQTLCCVPTQGTTTTTTSTTTTTTTTIASTTTTSPTPANCCPPLMQTLTSTEFPDGLMTFVYDNDACRTMVNATCSQTDPAFDLYAAIVANGQFFLDYGPNSITFPGTCNTATRMWEMGTPPLAITTLECRLTNPPSG